MYDAVFVLVEAFNKFLRKKPDRSNVRRTGISGSSQITNGTKALDCNSSPGWVTPFEFGDKISRLLRKVSTQFYPDRFEMSFFKDKFRFHSSYLIKSASSSIISLLNLKSLRFIP